MGPKVFPMEPASASSVVWIWAIVALVAILMAVLVAVLGMTLYAARHTTFEITPESLRIGAALYGRSIPLASVDRGAARAVDFTASPELRPRWRTSGVGLPGYLAGWCRLVDGEKALVFLTSREKAVYVPTTEGYALLLSPQDPTAFLSALKGP